MELTASVLKKKDLKHTRDLRECFLIGHKTKRAHFWIGHKTKRAHFLRKSSLSSYVQYKNRNTNN